jgi:tetratricopeptide (TPR) repeat protein
VTTLAHAVLGYPSWRPIGVGGFGSVYAARRTEDGAEVAVKVAHRAGDPRFAREREALERLPAGTAPRLLGHAEMPDGRPVLVLELLHGETLASWLGRTPRPALGEALARFAAACAAVAATHAAGVVHRDLKPANLFVCRDGSVRVLDFGLARSEATSGPLTSAGQRLGTPAYMAPEQCAGEAADERADVYALGAILFEVLCGRPPFVGDAATVVQAHATRRPWPPSTIEPSPEAARLDDVVLRCLAKDPAARYPGAGALAAAIRSAAAVASPGAGEGVQRARVALLCVASDAPRAELAAAVAPCGGAVARVHGDHHVISFAGAASPRRGIADALRAAARLGARARASRIHVDEVSVRLHASGPTVLGAAIDRPHAWPPASIACDGVALTEPAAALMTVRPAPPELGEPPLCGRDDVLAALEASARAALGARRPALAWLTGEVGAGKSRLARALGDRLGARVVVLAARDPVLGGDATREMLREILGLAPDAGPEEVAAVCHRLALALDGRGDEPPPASAPGARPANDARFVRGPRPARAADERRGAQGPRFAGPIAAGLGYALGAVPASAPAVRELREAPGAARVVVARAVAEALHQRAADAPLVVIADDAHWLDPAILDGVVRAVAGPAALWVLATARPDVRAPDNVSRFDLDPLAPDAARALLLDLLRPAEFVPEAILAPLLAAGRGVPLYLREAAVALRSAGALRTSSAGAWYVASDGLEHLASSPLFEQLAARHLAALPGDAAAFARMCAILGDDLAIPAIDAVQRLLERDGDRGGAAMARTLAPAVGIERLVRAGLVTADAGVRFRHPLLREAVERLAPAAERLAIHRAARRYHGERGASAAFARHAAACGDGEHAARAYLALGDEARRDHRYVLAETYYGAALEHAAAADDATRGAALAGRGKVRYRIQRMDEALADLDAARALAATDAARAALDLEASTVLDWSSRYPEARARADAALAAIERTGDERLRARYRFARGRDAFRAERWAEAIADLEAARAGDHETRVVAGLIAGMCLVALGRLDDAEAVFGEAIAACERRGDQLHLTVAYTNRIWLWSARGALGRAAEDLARAAGLAREIGQARLERAAEHNLAELLLWRGELAEAATRAARAHALQLRHVEQIGPEDALLVARIAVARGDLDHARAVLARLEATCPVASWTPTSALLGRMVRLALDAAPAAAWAALIRDAEGVLLPEELAELRARGGDHA